MSCDVISTRVAAAPEAIESTAIVVSTMTTRRVIPSTIGLDVKHR
jgi:hypothetical protein